MSDSEIVSLGPVAVFSLKWREIRKVVIRQRGSMPMGLRNDRVVVLWGPDSERLIVNSSVFSPADENAILERIRARVPCPVEEIDDGAFGP